MATKADLERELAKLRRELSDLKADRDTAGETDAPSPAESEDDQPDVRRVLADIGINTESMDDLGGQIFDELSALQKDKPLLVLLGAFALGMVLGRAMK